MYFCLINYYINLLSIILTDATDMSNTTQFDLPSPVSSIYSQNSRFA